MRARLVLLAGLLGACGGAGAGALSLSATDNDAVRIERALARGHAPAAAPRALGLFLVRSAPPELRALDLATGQTRWSVPADVRSRLAVGTTVVAAREGDALVARALADGRVLWRWPFAPGTRTIGLAADGDRIVYTAERGHLHAVAMVEGGAERWRLPAPGAVGAPAAGGGLVALPLQSQWLALLDGESGAVLARVRRNDLAVTGARVLPEGVTYGSRAVLRLDGGPAAAPLPAHLPPGVEATWFLDGYHPAQATYSALDRARLLWRTAPQGGFAGPVVALAFRALFAYDPDTGALRWARALPHADVVAAEHAGPVLLLVTAEGEIEVLDPESGALLAELAVGGRVAGAAFAAEGWRPTARAAGPPAATEDALAVIAGSRETHFRAARSLAVRELGRAGSAHAVTALVALINDAATPEELAVEAAVALRDRRDPAVVAPLLEALAVHADRVTGRRPRAVALLARVLGAARGREAVGPLLDHLEDPATPPAVLEEIAAALVAIGDRAAAPRLGSFVLLHRCDPDAAAAASVALDALVAVGGAAGREVTAFVATDPRTVPAVAARARERLGAP